MRQKSFILLTVLAMTVFVLSGSVGKASGDFAVGTALENFSLPDTAGKTLSFNELKGKKGTVVVFLSAQCPVVKQYNERINQIAADYAAKGIAFVGINSNATESLDWVKSDAAQVGYKFPLLIDKGNVLADKLGAQVTPEVYFFDSKNVLRYHGAIDNDKTGKGITEGYLTAAFDSSLSGKAIETTRMKAIGCSIKRAEAK